MTKDISPEADLDEKRSKLLRAKLGGLLVWKMPILTETIGPCDPKVFEVFEERRSSLVSSCIDQLRLFTDGEIDQILSRSKEAQSAARSWDSFQDNEIYRLQKQAPPWFAGGFGHCDRIADFVYWARQAFFSVDELTCLSIGFDPRQEIAKRIDAITAKDPHFQYQSVKFLIERHQLLTRQFNPNGYEKRVRPADFLRWVDRMEFEVHPDFLALLRKYHGPEQQRSPSRPLPKQDRREIDTIAQLFTAMAIDQLGYNPRSARSSVPREIGELASEMGLSISDDTVRKFLKLGASFIPDDWEPHNG